MSKRILFIWNYFYFPWEKGKSRFSDLAEAFVKAGYELEVACSTFYHMGKSKRDVGDERIASLPYRVSFLDEPGYLKNVSLARIRSIRCFNKSVRSMLRKHMPVDFVYVPVPSCKTALIAKKWCLKVGAKLVIDIEDLWPESFQMIIKPKWLCAFATLPLKRKANKCYRSADGIAAVSQTYLDRALSVRKDRPSYAVAPIGSDYEYVDSLREKPRQKVKPESAFWITYIGTLGSSYDIKLLLDACEYAYVNGHSEVALNILGSGPDEQKIHDHAKGLSVFVTFHGLMSYESMMAILFETDLGVNPIVKGSVASLINKVGDYAVAGVPVLNSQDCKEYCDLLKRFNAGISVPASNLVALEDALVDILGHKERLPRMKEGALELGRGPLSRKESQKRINELLDSL